MDFSVSIHLIFLCVVNIIFTFSGIILNTLVIASYWKSLQLRKKLCHFMIMVLSCFDLATVVTNNPATLLYLLFLLREHYGLLLSWTVYLNFVTVFYGYSIYVLLVMSIERYLGAYYPIFHRTSVTRRRLLTLLAVLLIVHTTLYVISADDMIISWTLAVIFLFIILFFCLMFINFKLFKISRGVRRIKTTSTEKEPTVNLKSISACLLVVACLVVLSISTCVYIIFDIISENRQDFNARLSYLWGATSYNMNCTFNSLIFFWKNKVLRAGGIKILKKFKDRLVRS